MKMNFETIIGLEIHIELKTASKMFCTCSTQFGAPPNTNTCPICLGMPGALPKLNQEAVRLALLAGRTLNCEINRVSKFDRKSYFYPDLPKGYQITQFYLPLCQNGYLDVELDNNQETETCTMLKNASRKINTERVEIDRIHLEEDAGKLIHPEDQSITLVDYNRAGVPLIEIVTKPRAISPCTAVNFLKELKLIMEYTEVSDCRMDQGSLRCDVNVSVRKKGDTRLGTKVEIKNLNSFKEIQKALEWEQLRQIELFQSGRSDQIISETRRWDSAKGVTVTMRVKGDSQHYYIAPEADLPSLDLADIGLDFIKKESIPELPMEKRNRFLSQYGLGRYEANILTESKYLADYFEEVIDHGVQPNEAVKWILTEILRIWKNTAQSTAPVDAQRLADLIKIVEQGMISRNIGKEVLYELAATDKTPHAIVEHKGLTQVSDRAEIQSKIQNILTQHQDAVEDYKSGSSKVLGYFMGLIMKTYSGQVDPRIAREILEDVLGKK